MASNKESLKYWKYENIFFVSTGEDGSAMLPALVFPSINEVGCAMKELQDNHEALHGVHHSQEVESACQLQFLEIMLQGDSNECLIWLDPTQKPRIETVDATRRRVAFQKGFLDWVLATGVPSGRVEGYVKVICLMLKQAQGEKSSTKVLENSTASTEGMKMTTASATTEKTSSKSSCPVETIEPKEASLMSSAEPERSSQQEKESKDAPTEKSKPVDDQAEPMDTTEDTNCKDPMLVESIKNSVTETSQAESNETDQAESTGTGDVMATTLGDSGMDIEKPDTQSESVAERSMTKDNGLVESRDQMESTSDAESSSMKSPRGKQGQKNKTQPARVSMTPPVRRSNRKVKSPNSSNSIVSASEEEDFEYVDSKKVVPILKRAGFVLKKNCYALPGCRESFSSLEELRRDICKHGMPNSDEWNTEERTLLEKWIRQSIFRTGDYSRGLPSNFEEFGDFKDMKRVAAFNYYDLSGLGCRYTYPGVSKEHSTALCHGVFDSEKDLLVSLARHGLPENLYKILSKEELLGLEVYVDMKVYPKLKPDFFCREPPYSDSPRKRSRAVRSEESVTSGTGSPSGRSKKVPKTSSSRGGFHPMATPTKSTKAAVEPSTPMTTSTSCTNLVSVDALPWPPSMDPVTEIEGTTDFERLEKAQALLGRKDVTVPVFDTESSLGLNLKKIHDMVCAVIRTAGRHGGDSPCGKFDESSSSKALYVCGVPGTGKTMSVTWICQHVLQAHRDGKISVERDDDEEDIEWNFLIQNANRVADVRTFRRNITEALGRKGAFSTVLKQKETGLVLVVDEIDSMIGKVEWERFLTELLEFANNETFHFALIGISNSVMDEKYAKILEFGKVNPCQRLKNSPCPSHEEYAF